MTGLAPGTTYHYRVYATNSVGTTFGPDGTFDTSAPLPQITTTAASFVTTTTTSLNGTVNPNGLPTSVYFRWGTRTDDLANQTAAQNVGSGNANIAFWAELSGLQPDTTYFFQAVAVNGSNVVPGSVLSFTTRPVKPTVTTLATTNISVTNAVLPGTVNPNGSESIYFFEYGTNTSFGAATAAQSAGAGTNTVSVSATLSNLAAGQTYYYRTAASNAFGISYGSAQSFSAGLPPPSATTLPPASLTTSSAQLRGSINPNNSFASAWFEWGTNSTNFTSTSRTIAIDTMESYTDFNLAAGNVSGGTGFGSYQRYSVTGGGTFLANNSANQTIDGTKSLGAWAGSGAGVSFRRAISNNIVRQFGSAFISARFNIDNTKGFSGFNLKSAAGSGASGFGSGELVSFGVAPAAGNNAILVTDASGQRSLDLGADVRNTIVDFKVDFDARNRRYVVGAKFRSNSTYTTLGGAMRGTGTNVTHLGFANWNTGNNQDLLFDSLQVLGSTPLGGGTNQITVSNNATGLAGSRLYHYRVASMNLDGGVTYGPNVSFFTGIDLAVSATNTNSSLVQGGTGQFTVNVANVGASTSTAAQVTVSNQLPVGMTMTSMSGTGWTFNSNNLTATRSGALNAAANYPPITVGFALAANAGALLTNTVTVTGGGDGNALNNTNTMVSSVSSGPDLAVSKATNSTYQQGGAGQFTVTVSNIGGTSTAGAVTVTEQPPAGMSITSMSGSGWTFNQTNSTVTRADALAAGTNYPPISIAVAVASNAASLLTNTVSVSGGGDANNGNNTATAAMSVSSGPDLAITKTPSSAFQQGGAGSFTLTVSNTGGTATTGTITVTEQPPTGMTVASMSGDGWTFDAQSLSATRSNSLAPGTSYPSITVGVSVASDAATTLTNVVSVSGGGDVNTGNNSAQSVVSVGLSLAPIDAWRTLHFGTANNSGAAADTSIATEDGMPNLVKYALGLDPTNAAAPSDLPSLKAFPPLAIKFRRAKDASDVTIHVEATDSMMNSWSNIWTSTTNAYRSDANFYEEVVTDSVPEGDSGQRYLRLKITRP